MVSPADGVSKHPSELISAGKMDGCVSTSPKSAAAHIHRAARVAADAGIRDIGHESCALGLRSVLNGRVSRHDKRFLCAILNGEGV